MYIFVMFEWCIIFILMHLDGYLLIIADRCHIVLLAISKPCIRFQWSLYRFQLKSPHIFSGTLGFPCWGQVQSFLVKSCICITYRIPHIIPCLHHVIWPLHVVDCVPFACCSCLGRAGRRVLEWGACWVRLRGSSQLWELCRQDDHTLEITSIFAC